MIASLALLLATTSGPAFLRMPDVRGDTVVFTSEGDLWVGSIASGKAHRLTSDPGLEQMARLSPDGKMVSFTAQYDGATEVYVMPVDGGEAKRLTNFHTTAINMGWTPDGQGVLFLSPRYPRYAPFVVPARGGEAKRLPVEFAGITRFGPEEGKFAFVRFMRQNDAWFRYQGGMQNQIWIGDAKTKRFKQVTNDKGTDEYPTWGGENVYYVNEQDARFTVMAVQPASGKTKKVAGPYKFEVRNLGTDGHSLVYEKGRGLELVDLGTGHAKELEFDMASDLIHARPTTVPADDSVWGYTITPTGKRVLAESRGRIVTLPVGEGEARVYKAKDGVRYRLATVSPDNKKLAYVSDETGDERLYVENLDGTDRKALTDDHCRVVNFKWSPDSRSIAWNDSEMDFRYIEVEQGSAHKVTHTSFNWEGVDYDWSPDSRWLVYTDPDTVTGYNSIVLYSTVTGKSTTVGRQVASDNHPSFSSDGKYLAFTSNRNFQTSGDPFFGSQLNTSNPNVVCLLTLQAGTSSPLLPKDPEEGAAPEKKDDKKDEKKPEFKIDLEGLEARRVDLPIPAGNWGQVEVRGDLVYVAGGGSIRVFSLKDKTFTTLTAGNGFTFSADGKKVLVGNRVVDAAARDLSPTAGTLSFGGLRLSVDRKAEWRQMFLEAWRYLRDYFFVKNMNGLDWEGIKQKYLPLVDSVRSRDELDILIRWMQSELGSSHEYLVSASPYGRRMLQGGFLGASLELDPSGYYRVSEILSGDGVRSDEASPLLEPGVDVHVGDFILEIGGQPLREGTDYRSLLEGRAGQVVSLRVNSVPKAEGSRVVRVRPVSSENRMVYVSWVEANRRMVDRLSGGRIGYLHMAAMGNQDVEDFVKQFYPQRHKEAMVIDVRFNNGGYTQSIITRILADKLSGYFNQRASTGSWSRQTDYFLGPLVALANEFNISCGEEFAHHWRDLKLGKLIGRRTKGGEVGSDPGWPLVDGGRVYVPNYGMWTPKDGWVIEGPGVSPDIDVPSDPNLYAEGRDPQLERAVQVLLAELKAHPVVFPKQPADPVKVKNGGLGD